MQSARDIPLTEAIRLVAEAAPKPVPERLPLAECYGRTLLEDVHSLVDHPNCDNSALDGFACREEDTAEASRQAPVLLRLVGDAPAGRAHQGVVGPGEAVSVYTGAPIPRGANAIVMVEATERHGDEVVVHRPASASDIRRQGEDFCRGQVYLEAGRRMGAAEVALAAAMGHAELVVARPPRVGILSTGDEVIEPGAPLSEGQVYNSNAYSLAGLVLDAGAVPVTLPRVADDPSALRQALEQAGRLDVLVTSGGVSMGRYDFVRDLLFEEGQVVFWKVAIRPGGPVLFGGWDDLPVLALPGNPVSSMVVFLLIARAWLGKALGSAEALPFDSRLPALSRSEFKGAGYKAAFRRGVLELGGGQAGFVVRSTGEQGSGILTSMAAANCLVVVPPHASVRVGDRVETIVLKCLGRT